MTQHPVEDLYSALTSQTWAALGGATLGARLRKYALPPVTKTSAGATPVDDLAVALMPAGGPPPRDAFYGSKSEWQARVGIVVRGAPRATKQPYDLAREVQRWAHNRSVSGYLRVSVEASDPISLGPDEGDRMLWEVPVRMWFHA